MDRRKALKNLTYSLGYAVATPTIFSILSSCTSEVETWKPVYFTEVQKHMVTHLVDIIIPATDVAGGLDVNVPQFMDLMYKDIEQENNQNSFQKGAVIFQKKFESQFSKEILKGEKEEIQELFESYFVISEDETKRILKEQKRSEEKISEEGKEEFFVYKFLMSVRYYAIFGYFTSEKVGEEILSYDPVPGVYLGCIPLSDVGNAWSL